MTTDFVFVHVSDPATNAKPGKSLQIRSRCMQGKNKREDSRRSVREKKRREKQAREQLQLATKSKSPVLSLDNTLVSDVALVQFAAPDIDAEGRGSEYMNPSTLVWSKTYTHLR